MKHFFFFHFRNSEKGAHIFSIFLSCILHVRKIENVSNSQIMGNGFISDGKKDGRFQFWILRFQKLKLKLFSRNFLFPLNCTISWVNSYIMRYWPRISTIFNLEKIIRISNFWTIIIHCLIIWNWLELLICELQNIRCYESFDLWLIQQVVNTEYESVTLLPIEFEVTFIFNVIMTFISLSTHHYSIFIHVKLDCWCGVFQIIFNYFRLFCYICQLKRIILNIIRIKMCKYFWYNFISTQNMYCLDMGRWFWHDAHLCRFDFKP